MMPRSAHPQQISMEKNKSLRKKQTTNQLVSNQILTFCLLHSVTSGNQTLPKTNSHFKPLLKCINQPTNLFTNFSIRK